MGRHVRKQVVCAGSRILLAKIKAQRQRSGLGGEAAGKIYIILSEIPAGEGGRDAVEGALTFPQAEAGENDEWRTANGKSPFPIPPAAA
jgi:hypothetical protein